MNSLREFRLPQKVLENDAQLGHFAGIDIGVLDDSSFFKSECPFTSSDA